MFKEDHSFEAYVNRKPFTTGKYYMHGDTMHFNDTRKLVYNPINRDTILSQPLGLSAREKAALKAFLLSLTDKRFK